MGTRAVTIAILALELLTCNAIAIIPPIYAVTSAQWAGLNISVGGRLARGTPIDLPCYSRYKGVVQDIDIATCNVTQAAKGGGTYIADHFGGYEEANWGSCQSTGESCFLGSTLPYDETPFNGTCYQGSVPSYYVEAKQVSDIQATMSFAWRHAIPLVIKNSGHDYRGRSAAPNSLAIWTHNYVPEIKLTRGFTPDGCTAPTGDVVTFGAGQSFGELYKFAYDNNIEVVGGTSKTVGPAGGWITGGGHSALSNTLGLGVDNVQQLRAVLPNGQFVTANRCQNTDVFFALRGGGGGTFGVITEMSTLAHPVKPLQLAQFTLIFLTPVQTKQFISIIVQNANRWAAEGWGGYTLPGVRTEGISVSTFTLMTPKLALAEAQLSMKPLVDFIAAQNITTAVASVSTIPNFYTYFDAAGDDLENANSVALAMSSRLVPTEHFEAHNQEATANALYEIVEGSTGSTPLFICITAPSNYKVPKSDLPGGPGASAVTPAWRKSPWHVIHTVDWDPTTGSPSVVNAYFAAAHNAMNPLRAMTPDGGAYLNEADTFEPDPAGSFWGKENYGKLLALKKKMDPGNLLTGHRAVRWEKTNPRYACYPKDPN